MAYRSKFTIENRKLKVGRSRTGLGLYTLEPIEKGGCIIEYKGREITPEEEAKSRSKYLFALTKKRTIDGAPRWNMARYVNHSCRPNCDVEIYRGHIYVMAKRNIKAGEELVYNYGKDYFDTFIKDRGCRCVKCRPPKRGERVGMLALPG